MSVTEPPPADGEPVDPDALVLGFVGALRAAGLPVSIHESITFAEALSIVGFRERATVRSAGRATLVKRAEHVSTYDAVFDAFWLPSAREPGGEPSAGPPVPASRGTEVAPEPEADDDPTRDPEKPPDRDPDGAAAPPTELVVEPRERTDGDDDHDADDDADGDEGADGAAETTVPVVRASADERLGSKDFAHYTVAERDEAHRLLADLRLLGAPRRSRRRRPRRRGGPGARVDLARTMRDARRHEGEVVAFRTTTPSSRPRPVVFLLDISGSMERYARPMLRLAQAGVTSGGRTRVEVFTMGTRLTRITRELTFHDPDVALERTAAAVRDWSGGTRLGADLRRFNDAWGTRGMARGATVVIVSDGWERGDPDALRDEMQRLARVTHRIVWVNPLKASVGYEPLARGMAAALPYVDQFVEGHSLDALGELVRVIAGAAERAPTPSRSGGTS